MFSCIDAAMCELMHDVESRSIEPLTIEPRCETRGPMVL